LIPIEKALAGKQGKSILMLLWRDFAEAAACGGRGAAKNREKMIEHFPAKLSKLRWLFRLAFERQHC